MRILSFFVSILWMIHFGYAQDFSPMKDIPSFKTKLKENAASLQSLQADFVQKKFLSFTDKPIQSSGKFYYKKEQNIRWETISPNKNIVVITQSYMKIFDGKKTQMFDPNSNKMFSQMNDIMMAAVNGDLPSEKNYKFRFLESSSSYKVILFPLNKVLKEFLKEIHITFDKEKLDITQLKLVEPGDDYTISDFKNRVTNSVLNAKLFDL